MSINWTPSSGFLAASAHIGWAAASVIFALHCGVPPWLIVGLFTGFAILKEFWADLTWLEHDTVAGSTLDFTTYMIGLGLGNLCWFVNLWLALGMGISLLIVMLALDLAGFFATFKDDKSPR